MHIQAIGYKCKITNDSSHLYFFFRMDSIKLSTDRSQLTIFRLVNIK